MYITLTTRCNMTCEHCCGDYTEKGEDMALETFRNVLDYDSEVITLGGGEPTLHPLFWQILGESIAHCDEWVWLATNGSQTRTAIALAKLARKGVLGVALSQDDYHDPIDPEVVEAFTRDKQVSRPYDNRTPDAREIRDVTGNEVNAGRCDFGAEDSCCCPGFMVMPDGAVRACGCADAPTLGNINEEFQPPDDWEWGECYRQQPGMNKED